MAHFPTSAPVLSGGAESIPALPSSNAARGALAVGVAEAAVLLVRGSAAAILLSPLLIAALFLAS